MNKKGFTLVELLGVIAVLAIIAMLVFPSIGDSIDSKKEKELNKVIDIVESAGKAYFSFNDDIYKVDIDTLKEEDYVTKELINPNTEEKLDGCVRKTLDSENIFTYTYGNCNPIEVPFSAVMNGGTPSQEFKQTYQDGTKIKLLEPTHSTKQFNGWQIVKGNSILKGDTLIIGTTETIIYAKWGNKPKLTVDLNGGSDNTDYAEYYKSGTIIELEVPIRENYKFVGWEVLEGNSVLSGNTLTIGTTNTVIKAKWELNVFNLSIDPNGGTLSKNYNGEYVVGTNIILETPVRTGYTFTGWTSTSGTISGNTFTMGNSDVTLTANWSTNTNTAYIVKHWTQNIGADVAQNSTNYTVNSTENKTGTTNTSVTPTVKTITGFTSPSTQTKTILADGSLVVNYYYARNSYTYTLGSNTGVSTSGSTTSGSYQYGATITLKASASAGYTWNKWTSSNTSLVSEKATANTTFTMPAGNVTMTPNVMVNTYAITYNLNGGTYGSSSPTSGIYGSTVTISNPSKTGYSFAGWTVSGTGAILSDTKLTIGTGNITLTAKWNVNSPLISYNCANGNKGSSPYSINYTGNCTVIDDGNGNWRIKFLTTGDLTVNSNVVIDAFLLGGGGAGTSSSEDKYGGGGGGGGYAVTTTGLTINSSNKYTITIGAGGTASGGRGGSTTAFSKTAEGGYGGSGRTGGSGGNSGGNGANSTTTTGTNGSEGNISTREFGETNGTQYAGGGGGGGGGSYAGGSGGSGGGGTGGSSSNVNGKPGDTNTGGGGGGGSEYYGRGKGSAGGSGIVVIRNSRVVKKFPSTNINFDYTGSYELIDDGSGNWRLKFLTSGVFTVSSTVNIDAFLVGGGGGGAASYEDEYAGGGGGGGYAKTVSYLSVTKGNSYTITIGAGGSAGGGQGGSTTAFNNTAEGGYGGSGKTGGSGGNKGGNGASTTTSAGNNGTTGSTATKEFGVSTGTQYAGGGGGGGGGSYAGGAGGIGGGGAGGSGNGNYHGFPGAVNTGGGGGGGTENEGRGLGSAGGSGIVIIRNSR